MHELGRSGSLSEGAVGVVRGSGAGEVYALGRGGELGAVLPIEFGDPKGRGIELVPAFDFVGPLGGLGYRVSVGEFEVVEGHLEVGKGNR